jgi:molybdopterin molybdotransferase
MMDLKKAQRRILDATPVLGRESVPILDALKRILVQDIMAVEDLPASDISAMDGYALCHTFLHKASTQNPVRFRIIGESPAGWPFGGTVGAGEAVRIMTGGVVPKGADTVVKLEDTREEGGYVICRDDPGPGVGIRFRGDSLKKGQKVLSAGDVVGPMEIGALASLRRAYVYVHRKPLVAILSTGDELSDFHEPSLPSKAMCSNLYTLAAQTLETGGIPLCLGIVPDDLDEIENVLNDALHADVIITSGGTSKGKYDLVNKAVFSLGMEMRFSNIFAKPGKPTIFGIIGKKMIFGCPGNPSATLLSFEQFIKPALLKMMGHREIISDFHRFKSPFALIDSFNEEEGGNKDHQRAPQIPLGRPLPGAGKQIQKHKRDSADSIPEPIPACSMGSG